MQARGLKPEGRRQAIPGVTRSRLMQARGLKQRQIDPNNIGADVAPHAGAWIETAD